MFDATRPGRLKMKNLNSFHQQLNFQSILPEFLLLYVTASKQRSFYALYSSKVSS